MSVHKTGESTEETIEQRSMILREIREIEDLIAPQMQRMRELHRLLFEIEEYVEKGR